ncbi:Selenium-binding protein 2 [Hibiscus syriacus]|uniref:Selenium-binding protein 2 n=1 Tax=Hibiscus syriacus TaxID=106335 RepID=A0A6A2Y7H5_HIBSY|nr:Selenium-binding protein 2 [Hibiscus syriacus]
MGEESGCCKIAGGPGDANPLEGMSFTREALLYVTCVYNGTGREKPDFWQRPTSIPTHPLIRKLYTGCLCRILAMNFITPGGIHAVLAMVIPPSGHVYVIDTQKSPKAPPLHKVVEPADIVEKTSLVYPHTSHCLATGDIIISFLGDKDGHSKGNRFLLLDSQFNIKGSLSGGRNRDLKLSLAMIFGRQLFVYDWSDGHLKQTLDLGDNGLIPGEIRFLHEPSKNTGYVECVLPSNVVRFFKTQDGSWGHEAAIQVQPLKVENWTLPEMPGLIIGLLISLDDQFLYFVNWFHGDVRQYNIEYPKNPVFVGQVYVGGLLQNGSPIVAVAEDGTTWQADVPTIQDGKRLYVTNSLFSTWDRQFYPDVIEKGSHVLLIDVDTKKGGLKINPDFFCRFRSRTRWTLPGS